MKYISPAPLKTSGYETSQMKQIYTMTERSVRFLIKNFHKWDKRDDCGYFFKGNYWYGQDQNMSVFVTSFLAKFGDLNEYLCGITRKELTDISVQAIRYACLTHEFGPEDCVRNTDHGMLAKWGCDSTTSESPEAKYFQGTQVGSRLPLLALAAWFLWDELDGEIRQYIYDIMTDYAERWSSVEPRDGAFFDTQTEENGWTALGISAAAYIFADDPRSAKWREAAIKWMLNSSCTPKDMFTSARTSDGVPLRSRIKTITLLPDYTTENHSFVHPNYLCTPMEYRITMGLLAMLSGKGEIPGIRHNLDNIYKEAFMLWVSEDGGMIPVQSQDWWYFRTENHLAAHTIMNLLFESEYAAYLEKITIDTLEAVQSGHENGTFISNEPDKCIISSANQTMNEMEIVYSVFLIHTYLWHMCLGEGKAPVEKDQYEEHVKAVKHYNNGGSVIQRTENSFSCFSYRNVALAAVFPKSKLWSITVPPCSTFGAMNFKGGCDGNPGWANTGAVRFTENVRIRDDKDCFSASCRIDRGLGQIEQRVSFVSLPNGNAVYFQRVKALKDCEITEFTSGLVGVRNEYYKNLPQYAKGHRTIKTDLYNPIEMKGYVGGEDIPHIFKNASVVSIDDEISYILCGSKEVRYTEHHNYPKWKGIEDFLILNMHEDVTLKAGEELPYFSMIFLPNAPYEKAESIRESMSRSVSAEHECIIAEDTLYYSSFSDDKKVITAEFEINTEMIPLFEGKISFRDGVYSWTNELNEGECGYKKAAAFVSSERDFDAAVLTDSSVLVRYDDENGYHLL
ncbi:MAG: hypothetical protein E7665_02660 [Ruminococcaceae bacterium]|nr:hypothetical protein [Oscillospiraceae bacterium]